MTALWIALAPVGYIVIAALTIRGFAKAAERRGNRDQELRKHGILDEVFPGLIWPITLPVVAIGALLIVLHALATKGIGKENR